MIWVYLALIVASLFLSACISGSETAYLSVNRFRMRNLARQKNRGARRVLKVIGRPERLFGAILLVNNLVNILIATLTGALIANIFQSSALVVPLATLSATVAVVILSEITPKSIAAATSDRWALRASAPINLLVNLISPVSAVVGVVPRVILRAFGVKHTFNSSITPAELRMLIHLGEEDGAVESRQGAMLENIFRFGEKNAADVMTPRPEIDWAYVNDTIGDFLNRYARHHHTRYPVLDPDKDDVVGVVSAKQVLESFAKRGYNLSARVKALMNEPLFVPETHPLPSLFNLMRQSGNRLALALDEYGAVSGLVTMTRLIEQVVGATGDDGQAPVSDYKALKNGAYLVDAGMSVEDARDQLGVDAPPGDFETMAGCFLAASQRIPKEGEEIAFKGFALKVAKMDGNRIVNLIVTKETPAELTQA